MFVVTETEATAIRTAYVTGGESAAACEVWWLFRGIPDMEHARACARTIASWSPREPQSSDPPPAAAKPSRPGKGG
jgi:hypothetical protein